LPGKATDLAAASDGRIPVPSRGPEPHLGAAIDAWPAGGTGSADLRRQAGPPLRSGPAAPDGDRAPRRPSVRQIGRRSLYSAPHLPVSWRH
jgi:hypothetical protein